MMFERKWLVKNLEICYKLLIVPYKLRKDKDLYMAFVESEEMLDDHYNKSSYQSTILAKLKLGPPINAQISNPYNQTLIENSVK